MAFHGAVGPASGVNFPLLVQLYLTQQGNSVPGAAASHTFHTSSDTSNLAFSQIIQVSAAPSVLEVMPSGGNFIYSGISLVVHKIGDLTAA